MSELLRSPRDDRRAHGSGTVAAIGDSGGPAAGAEVGRAAARLGLLAARWQRRVQAGAMLASLAIGLPLAAGALRFAPAAVRLPLVIAAVLVPPLVVWLALSRRRADPAAIAAHLDRRLPALGESAALLLAPVPLPPLQRLQQRRAAVVLLQHDEDELRRTLPWRPWSRAAVALAAGLVLALLVAVLPMPARRATAAAPGLAGSRPSVVPPTPLLRSVAVTVQPPAYTGRRARTSSGLGGAAEEGARVRWRVAAAPAVTAAALLFDETERRPLRRLNGGDFELAATARAPRLVRLLLDGPSGELWRSAPARLEVLADRPPALELLAPAATLVERPPQRPGTLALEVALADDYGLAGAELVVTLAAGSGEQVNFAEQRLPLPVRRVAARQLVRHSLDLAALGLAAESELYVRVEARDGRRPDPAAPPQPNVVRSPTVVVRPQLERRESAPLGEGLPLIAGPELFRSQRQVVLDTERLIAEMPRLAAAEVMRRSQVISFDQRALRLRYGTLLGQEFEDGRPVGIEEGPRRPAEGISAPSLGGIDDVPADLRHEHESEENATFLPPPVRSKLRAMLAAMWDAEGALATGAPRAALPHELRALGLLKEVQQADRVYVRRTAGEGAPLDPARRLTGELDEVRPLAAREPAPPPRPVVEAALGLLAALEESGGAKARARGVASPAGAVATLSPALAARARSGSAAALAALPALDALAGDTELSTAARTALERALWELVPPPQAPVREAAPAGSLWDRYRKSLGEMP
jgi:hypothetical protein